jgi:hypothetical protein
MLAADLLAKPKLFADATGNTNVKSARPEAPRSNSSRPVDGGPPLPMALWNMLLNAGLVCPGKRATALDGAIITGIERRVPAARRALSVGLAHRFGGL